MVETRALEIPGTSVYGIFLLKIESSVVMLP